MTFTSYYYQCTARTCHMSADAPAQATCTSGRARCHAGGPHDPPPRTRCPVSAPSGEPTRPSTPLPLLSPAPGPWAQGSRRCAWAPCGAHAFCLMRCPARARAGSNGSCTSGRGSNRGRTGGGPAGQRSTGRSEFDFFERAGWSSIFHEGRGEGGGGEGGQRDDRQVKVRNSCSRASIQSSTPG